MVFDIIFNAAAAAGVPVFQQAVISTNKLSYSCDLLDYCKTNACGNYNKSWTCPPACKNPDEQREMILFFKNVLVFTTKHDLEDSFDYEGMTRGMDSHASLTLEIKNRLGGLPAYGAGACPVCKTCAFPQPCRFPEKQIGSIEAAGINVTELSKAAGINYNNGPDTVTYFSMILL